MTPETSTEDALRSGQAPLSLGPWLRAHRVEILARWEGLARVSSKARALDARRLLDHLPTLLEELAARADTGEGPVADERQQAATAHALQRLDQGYDLADVTSEYALLRRSILEMFEEEAEPRARGDVVLLNQAIDEAVSRAVARYASAHQRTLQGIDRVAAVALAGGEGVALLEPLLSVLMETTASVDTASLFLKEGDKLVLRAEVGSPSEGEGIASATDALLSNIAATRAPASLSKPARDDATVEHNLGAHRIQGLHGVPLIAGGDLIGVATMASRTAAQFSDEDCLLFRTMANRATSLIAQAIHQEQVARRVDELEAVLNSIPDAVYIGDANGLTRCNLAAAQMLGFEEPAQLLRSIESLIQTVDTRDAVTGQPIALEDQPFMRATRGESTVRDVRVRHVRTGNTLVVRCSAAPLRWGGKVVGAVAVTSDVTRQKKATADSAEALALRDRVLGILGHELRDPLSAMRAAVGLLLRQPALPDGLLRTVQRIDGAAERMTQLIGNLLDFTQTRFLGAIPIAATDSDLASVCQRVVQEVELGSPQHAIRFSSTGETQGRWDPARIAQIVSNLLVNAIRHGDGAWPIHVNLDGGASSVLLEVHNWGRPIPEALLPTIFEPFRRGPAAGGTMSPGLGLGLYIVEQIVRAHGGEVRVRSSEKEGTTFSVSLPRAASLAR